LYHVIIGLSIEQLIMGAYIKPITAIHPPLLYRFEKALSATQRCPNNLFPFLLIDRVIFLLKVNRLVILFEGVTVPPLQNER